MTCKHNPKSVHDIVDYREDSNNILRICIPCGLVEDATFDMDFIELREAGGEPMSWESAQNHAVLQ